MTIKNTCSVIATISLSLAAVGPAAAQSNPNAASPAAAMEPAPAVGGGNPGATPPETNPANPSSTALPAQPFSTSDWPCPQRKVETLSAGQVWDGPPIDDVKGWAQDPKIKDLIPVLASRRVSMEQAAQAIKDYADSLPKEERDTKLTLLFAGLLDTINADRSTVVHGIEKYQQRQRSRSAELEHEGVEIAKLTETAKTDTAAAAKLKDATELYDWNARIFQERQKNVPLACEIPVLFEQRVYELAREIRSHMSG